MSPPGSRRTSEATKLPPISELEKTLPTTIDLTSSASSPTKRGSLATITEEGGNNSRHPIPHHLPFPPEYPGSTIAAIPKGRSNSYPPSSPASYPPPPPPPFSNPDSPNHFQPAVNHPNHTDQAIAYNHEMSRLVKAFGVVLFLPIHLVFVLIS